MSSTRLVKTKLLFFITHIIIYFNDLHVFDLGTFKWQEINPTPGCLWPSARSGFQLSGYQDAIYMHGGYLKEVFYDKKTAQKKVRCQTLIVGTHWNGEPLWTKAIGTIVKKLQGRGYSDETFRDDMSFLTLYRDDFCIYRDDFFRP
ncbi:hypothetical protein LXL04_025868 [Taraxacum kok-saghyz]